MATPTTLMARARAATLLLCALAALGGCATITDTNQQTLTVRTILDNREVAGVGCVLANDVGRWFVTAPGRVTIQRNHSNLWIDCRKAGVASGKFIYGAKNNAMTTLGNAVFTAGMGYVIDEHTGAGFDYPSTLTVLMTAVPREASDDPLPAVGTPVY